MRRTLLITLTTVALSLFAAASAGAVVIDMGASGRYGVALVPGTRASLGAAGIPTVTASAPCTDPWLAFDSMIQAAAANGWIDRRAAALESLLSIRRAGAQVVLTYFALDVPDWLA